MLKRSRASIIGIIIILVLTSVVLLVLAVSLMYPRKYQKEIESLSAKYGVDKYLIMAIIKTESGYKENAVSNKSARGLMQITDSTAKYISEKIEIYDYDIYQPVTNIEFGVYYVSYLQSRFETMNETLCAYNAGEGNVRLWLSNKDYSSDSKTLSVIPFTETYNYVKKVNFNYKVYKFIY